MKRDVELPRLRRRHESKTYVPAVFWILGVEVKYHAWEPTNKFQCRYGTATSCAEMFEVITRAQRWAGKRMRS